MRAPSHLHNSAGLFLATVLLLLGGVGVVSAQQGPSRPAEVAPAPVIEDPVAEHVRVGRPTIAPPTTTTLAPTTTTTVAVTVPPTTPTTAAPRRVTTPTAPPVAVAPPTDGPTYAMGLLREVIPARWLAVLPVTIAVIPGTTSWSSWDGLIQIGDWHLFHAVDRAKNTLAHEWAHQVAWHYGTDAYNGAPPAGFPYAGPSPQEQFADCVAQALTGTVYPSAGLGACPADALTFTQQFLGAGPGPRLR
jgi:hypothetical protein